MLKTSWLLAIMIRIITFIITTHIIAHYVNSKDVTKHKALTFPFLKGGE